MKSNGEMVGLEETMTNNYKKALDVAIEMLKEIQAISSAEGVIRGIANITLDEIERILKDNQEE